MLTRLLSVLLVYLMVQELMLAQLPRNGFEGTASDTWNFTVFPARYNVPAEDDIWTDTAAVSVMAPFAGDRFWFMRDLENPNGGGAFFHTLTFEPIALAGLNASAVSFAWNAFGYEPSDSIGYIIAFDNDTTWNMANYVDLNRNTEGWRVVQYPIPAGAQYVRLRLMAKQNGNGDYAGFDEVVLEKALPPAVIEFGRALTHVEESAGVVTIPFKVSNLNANLSKVKVSVSAFSTAVAGVDYDYAETVFTFSEGGNNPTEFQITVLDDNLLDAGRYLVLTLSDFENAVAGVVAQHIVLINDNDIKGPAPVIGGPIQMKHIGSFAGSPNGGSAEISAYDKDSKRLFVTNITRNTLDIVNFSNPAAATPIKSVNMTPFGGGINSVAVRDGIVACAVEATPATNNGKVVFLNTDGDFINEVTVGALPDMVIFSPDGTKVLTANEGEPSNDYTVDPLGSVSIIDMTPGVAQLTQANVTTLTFEDFDAQQSDLVAQGLRVFGPGARLSQDLEPEAVSVTPDNTTAIVTLQEANALAIVDLVNLKITEIRPLGTKDHSLLRNALDASNTPPRIFMANWPVKGFYLPDDVATITIGGVTYAITANEGDTRAYAGYDEEARVNALPLDPIAFPNAAILKNDNLLGRLLVTRANGDTDSDGDYDELYSIGARSFAIWNIATGQLVWDSGDEMERITAEDSTWGPFFNSSHGNTPGFKNRSDDKGPEPEGVAVAEIDGRYYAFVSLERIGGVLLYDITDPANPFFIQYLNTRRPTGGGDRGPEGILYIPHTDSPDGRNLIVLSNEVSGTLTVIELQLQCPIDLGDDRAICEGDATELEAPEGFEIYQWSNGGTSSSITVNQAGIYFVEAKTRGGCVARDTVEITVLEKPVINLGEDKKACQGETVTLSAGAGFAAYTWNDGQTTSAIVVTASGTYTVTVTNSASCTATDSVIVTFFDLPVVSLGPDTTVLDSILLEAPIGVDYSYLWNTGATSRTLWVKASGTYTVTVTDANGCSATDEIKVTIKSSHNRDLTLQGEWRLFPNPASEWLRVQLSGFEAGHYSLVLTDAIGRIVWVRPLLLEQIPAEMAIDINDLPSGMYSLQLTNGYGRTALKFVRM